MGDWTTDILTGEECAQAQMTARVWIQDSQFQTVLKTCQVPYRGQTQWDAPRDGGTLHAGPGGRSYMHLQPPARQQPGT